MVLGAVVEIVDIKEAIPCVGHGLDHVPQSVFETLCTYRCFKQKDVGLTNQFGSSGQDPQIKAFSIDLDQGKARRLFERSR